MKLIYNIYNVDMLKTNIEEVLQQATSSIYKDAKDWYPKAHRYAEEFSEKYNKPIEITSALISVLSPQKEWFHNLKLTEEFLKSKGRTCRHVEKQKLKARKIYALNDVAPANIEMAALYLGGLKTTNFFFNILNPSDPKFVTIDSHMLQLMTGMFEFLKPTVKQYTFMKNVLIDCAKENKMIPSEFQSVLWLTWKNVKPKRINQEAEVEYF
jgi:hypothetical protein